MAKDLGAREVIVDLHIHSHYSRATSRDLTLNGLYRWGKIKGIHIIGTGDFTHPRWFKELREQLILEDPTGLYRLNEPQAKELDSQLPSQVAREQLWFVPTVEISSIYSKGGKVRKLHQLVIMPNLETASELNSQLERIGNISSDGRPILGLDSKALLKLVLATTADALYIPAHIWTPWFAAFGSRSGFDRLEDAYEELTPEIHAIETGLSSDPYMNWRLKQLEGLTIMSNSDAHSPQKLGREATIMKLSPSYKELMAGIITNDHRVVGTIEFYPEEGKYHYDGHRDCNVCLPPTETKRLNGRCPKCGKPLTVGVDYRVEELADQPEGYLPKAAKRVEYIIPLIEVLSEIKGKGPNSKAVQEYYWRLIGALGSEFDILRRLDLTAIAAVDKVLAEAIRRLRQGEVSRQPGYDGVYGVIKVFGDGFQSDPQGQLSFL